MNPNEGILELIEMLYSMISEAWGVPLGNDKCLVDREKALDIVEEIKARMPGEMAEAKRLVSARNEFISNAKREAESIRKMAEESSRKLVDEQEIVRQARAKAEEILAEAESKSFELRRVAAAYVNDVLQGAETAAAGALQSVQSYRQRFGQLTASAEESQQRHLEQQQSP